MERSKNNLLSPEICAGENPHNVLVMRHGEDGVELTEELDQSLTLVGQEEARESAHSAAWLLRGQGYDSITIETSPKKRSVESTEIAAEAMEEVGIKVINANFRDELREMYQGSFVISPEFFDGDLYMPLENAWQALRREISLGNIDYRFGDPAKDKDGISQYPELEDLFYEFGENQREYTLRLFTFLEKLLETRKKQPPTQLPLIIAHQATASRTQRILGAIEYAEDHYENESILEIEQKFEREKVEHGEFVALGDFNFKYDTAQSLIGKEIMLLEGEI
jgi:broad specificity phosphatase PhoE